MKRERPPKDENGIERPHKSKRSRTEYDRPAELGPITALHHDCRSCLYLAMSTQSRARLARTCRGFAKDLITPTWIWIPATWRKQLMAYTPTTRQAAKHFIQKVLRPARFFERLRNVDALVRMSAIRSGSRVDFVIRGSLPPLGVPADVYCKPKGDDRMARSTHEEVAAWMAELVKRSDVRQAKQKEKARVKRIMIPEELLQRKETLMEQNNGLRIRAHGMRSVGLADAADGRLPTEWRVKVEEFAAILNELYRGQEELVNVCAEIDAIINAK